MMQYDFCDRVRSAMEACGYSERMLLARTGVTREAMERWRNGHYPNAAVLIDLADELRVSADELLGLNENALQRAMQDVKRSGCATCRYGVTFEGCVAVCGRQGDGVFPKENLACWIWHGWTGKAETISGK